LTFKILLTTEDKILNLREKARKRHRDRERERKSLLFALCSNDQKTRRPTTEGYEIA
jgi:hypothetical protein